MWAEALPELSSHEPSNSPHGHTLCAKHPASYCARGPSGAGAGADADAEADAEAGVMTSAGVGAASGRGSTLSL